VAAVVFLEAEMSCRLRQAGAVVCAVFVVLGCFSVSAKADLTSFDIGKNVEYNQTGANTVVPAYAFFSAYAYFPNVGDYDTGTMTYPGAGSPQTLSPGAFGGPNVSFQTFALANQAAMDAAYPFGTYTAQAFNTGLGTSSTAVGINYSQDAYASNLPQMSAASFAAFQGMNPAKSLTVNFNAFSQNPVADASWTFFNIYSSTGVAFGAEFLPNTTTSVTIPGGTLAPNTTYQWEMNFDNRIDGTDINGSGIPTQQ
jgi:hypothetical protein